MKKIAILFLLAINAVCAQTIPYYIPANGLVAWYPFNSNAKDSSGNGNDATFIGAGVSLTSDRFSQTNNAYDFAGNSNDYIRIPADNFPTGNRTVSLWFKVPTVANRPMLLGYGGGGNLGYGTSFLMGLNVMGTGSYHCQAHYLSNAIDFTYSSDPINTWNHFAVTVNGNEMRMYVNGVLTQTNTAFTYSTIVAGKDLVFGVMPGATGMAPYTDANGGYLQGKLDDIGFWNRALSAVEISRIYNNCGVLFSSQPVNQTKNAGANAQFAVASTYTNATYQWQSNGGSGFADLSNTGQYSGANTATLLVSNVSVSNYGQMFRCVTNNGVCSDTSSTAVLYVSNPAGLIKTEKDVVKIFPNPFKDQIQISAIGLSLTHVKLLDLLGNELEMGTVYKTNSALQISLEHLTKGIYFIEISENNRVLAVKKIVKN